MIEIGAQRLPRDNDPAAQMARSTESAAAPGVDPPRRAALLSAALRSP